MNIQFLVALLIMAIGLVGSVFPLLPGPAIIWLGALFYAWSTSFQPLGWITLALLALIALAASTSDIWVGAAGQRRAGAGYERTRRAIRGRDRRGRRRPEGDRTRRPPLSIPPRPLALE